MGRMIKDSLLHYTAITPDHNEKQVGGQPQPPGNHGKNEHCPIGAGTANDVNESRQCRALRWLVSISLFYSSYTHMGSSISSLVLVISIIILIVSRFLLKAKIYNTDTQTPTQIQLSTKCYAASLRRQWRYGILGLIDSNPMDLKFGQTRGSNIIPIQRSGRLRIRKSVRDPQLDSISLQKT